MLKQMSELVKHMIENKSMIVGIVGGTIGSFFDGLLNTASFSNNHIYLFLLLLLIIGLDFVVGIRIAHKNKMYQSNIGIDAVIRNALILLTVVIGWLIDKLLGTGALVFGILSLSLAYHNFQSFVANLYVLGWDKWFPIWLFKLVEVEVDSKIKKYKITSSNNDETSNIDDTTEESNVKNNDIKG
ncbi:MAG: holin family protein [Bacillales bacterium]|jgi:phage-related holin|nr:holin family protein [Bacillales bacterium]